MFLKVQCLYVEIWEYAIHIMDEMFNIVNHTEVGISPCLYNYLPEN